MRRPKISSALRFDTLRSAFVPRESGARNVRRFISAPVLCAAALLFTACGDPSVAPIPAGEEAYLRYCAACHGAEGRSVEGMLSTPNLANEMLLALASDDYLTESIRMGRPGENGREKPGTKMSVYGADLGGPIQASEIDAIVAHVRSWQAGPSITLDESYAPAADANVAAGAERYARECAACHGEDGWGELSPRLAGGTFQSVASDDFIRQSILRGRPGTRMPAFDYSAQEVDEVVEFIRTLGSIR